MAAKIIVRDKHELKNLIIRTINQEGRKCSLNFIDVSHITDMSYLFMNIPFKGDISQWDVSKVMCQLPIFRTDLKYTKSPCSCQPILHRSKII